MKRIALISAIVMFILVGFSRLSSAEVTCHFSFDNPEMITDLLKQDWVEQTGLKTPEERKWKLTDGKFGQSLYLGAVPLKYDHDNLSGLDLDIITAVIFNVGYEGSKGRGYDEPFVWGAGKLHPALGAVSFWVKGSAEPEDKSARTILFSQTSTTWGRKEKYLIEIELYRDRTITAFIEDARYNRHRIQTSPVWKENQWNHVVFNWDRSSGISLWVNGVSAASSMGNDAWWENQRPGLFHLPMSLASYDEFYIFSTTLNEQEILGLYNGNRPPSAPSSINMDSASAARLKKAFISESTKLPVLKNSKSNNSLVITELTPSRIHDGGISGWWLSDGRYELAWPHEYSCFTIIPGDVDFHAEKADILPPAGSKVNYITFEGNLDDIPVYREGKKGSFGSRPVVRTGRTESFFHGALYGGSGDSELRVDFTKSWGVPDGFQSDGNVLRMPLSGKIRLQEIGLFNVEQKKAEYVPGEKKFYISLENLQIGGKRYPSALNALLSERDRRVLSLTPVPSPKKQNIELLPMTVVNLLTPPVTGKTAYNAISLVMAVSSPENNVLTVRILDPAVPSHTWSHAEVKLDGFSSPGIMELTIAFDPVYMTDSDRMWIQVFATDGMTIKGDKPAVVTLKPREVTPESETAWVMKTMRPCIMGYGRSFEYIPWQWDKKMPDVDSPVNFGGQFDMAYPWQAVLKIIPGDKTANIYKAFTDLLDPSLPAPFNVAYPFGRYPLNIDNIPDKKFEAPDNAPSWAVYYRVFQTYRGRVIDWWRTHLRSDGQSGGGWNDDTLIFSRSFGDMPLDSNEDAKILYNKTFEGFEKTNYFHDGYCRITPIDRLHVGDFVRERYKSLIYNLGDLKSALWAMEEAWHWGKPDKTPMNYGDGRGFLFGKDVLEWYWGKQVSDKPYILQSEGVFTEELRKAAIINNDTTFWRVTEAWVHTDDQSQYGASAHWGVTTSGPSSQLVMIVRYPMYDILFGGWGVDQSAPKDSNIQINLGVGWPEGGGPDTGRLVEYSGNDRLRVRMYSFSPFEKEVVARIFRLDSGTYSLTLKTDPNNDGIYENTAVEKEIALRRFDDVPVMLPPRVPAILEISQIRKVPEKDLPDLAIGKEFIKRKGNDILVSVYNIGCGKSGSFNLSLVDESGKVMRTVYVDPLEGSGDFMPKKTDVIIPGVPKKGNFRIVADLENAVSELYKGNNSVNLGN